MQKQLKRFSSLLLTTAISLMAPIAIAEGGQGDQSRNEALKQAFIAQYGKRFDTGELLSYITRTYKEIDLDGQGLTREKIDLFEKIYAAKIRMAIALRYLPYDLNADGIVDHEEAETVIKANLRIVGEPDRRTRRGLKQRLDRLFKDDPNKDGRIEIQEYGTLFKMSGSKRGDQRKDHSIVANALLALDPDRDGLLTHAEAALLIGSAFQGVTIKPQNMQSSARAAASCKVPKRTKDEELILLGAYQGKKTPSLTLVGQDKETFTGKLVIEPGSKPLYLAVTVHSPVIWRLEGAVERIKHLVVAGPRQSSGKIAAGVMGLDASKVSFLSEPDCLRYFHKIGNIKMSKSVAMAKQTFGTKPTIVHGLYSVDAMSLPSGKNIGRRDDPRLLRSGPIMMDKSGAYRVIDKKGKKVIEMLDAHKLLGFGEPNMQDSYVSLDKTKVVSEAPVEEYATPPGKLGLIQLLKQGALERISRREYRILKKIHIPAGLHGADSARFLLKSGVPEPVGDPGHSCVFSEEKGKTIAGRC
nr:hypothetical protein [uncultured Cohaesibacter sp.]